MVFDDSSSSKEKEDDKDFETILGMIFNDDIRRPRRGSQFDRIHIVIEWRATPRSRETILHQIHISEEETISYLTLS